MTDPWHFAAIAIIGVILLNLTLRLAFSAWFRAKEHFVERIHRKLGERGENNGAD